MVEVKDRIPTYPGRVKLVPVAGQPDTYDMVRADEPIEPGTPVNKALFDGFTAEMSAIKQQVEDKIFEMSQRVRIGDLTEGAVFGLYENGVLVPFIKLANSYQNGGIPLVIRKNCVTKATLTNAGETYYDGCKTDRWLSNNYLSYLDTAVQSVIPNVYIETTMENGLGSLRRKVFLLSLSEYFMTSSYVGSEGGSVGYFSVAGRRIASLNGTPVNHWTRNINRYNESAAYITTSGEHEMGATGSLIAGIRPAFLLPADFEVTVVVPSAANTMATAEVI